MCSTEGIKIKSSNRNKAFIAGQDNRVHDNWVDGRSAAGGWRGGMTDPDRDRRLDRDDCRAQSVDVNSSHGTYRDMRWSVSGLDVVIIRVFNTRTTYC